MEKQVQAADNAEMLSHDHYNKGVTSYFEYLESLRNAFDARLRLSGKKAELLHSYMQLYLALGGGWHDVGEERSAQ